MNLEELTERKEMIAEIERLRGELREAADQAKWSSAELEKRTRHEFLEADNMRAEIDQLHDENDALHRRTNEGVAKALNNRLRLLKVELDKAKRDACPLCADGYSKGMYPRAIRDSGGWLHRPSAPKKLGGRELCDAAPFYELWHQAMRRADEGEK